MSEISNKRDKYLTSKIVAEFNKTLIVEAEKAHQNSTREKNRWNNFLNWVESKKTDVIDRLSQSLAQENPEEEAQIDQKTLEFIEKFIGKTRAKIEHYEKEATRIGDLLQAARLSHFNPSPIVNAANVTGRRRSQ